VLSIFFNTVEQLAGASGLAGYAGLTTEWQSFDNFQIRHVGCGYSFAFGICFM